MRLLILVSAIVLAVGISVAAEIGMVERASACIRDGAGAARSAVITRCIGRPGGTIVKAATANTTPVPAATIPTAGGAVELLRITFALPEDDSPTDRGLVTRVWLRLPAEREADCGSPRRRLLGDVSLGRGGSGPAILDVRISDLSERDRSAVLAGRASLKLDSGRTPGGKPVRVLAVEYVTVGR